MTRFTAGLAALSLIAGCRSVPPPPVPVAADAATVSRLAGTWEGSYQSAALRRAGSIVFTLVSGEDHAHGDVVMVPGGANRPLGPAPGTGAPGMDSTRSAQVLTVRFVRAAGDSVMGVMSPYIDPDCGCPTTTTFRGKVDGNRIRGVFEASQGPGRTMLGTWDVRRKN